MPSLSLLSPSPSLFLAFSLSLSSALSPSPFFSSCSKSYPIFVYAYTAYIDIYFIYTSQTYMATNRRATRSTSHILGLERFLNHPPRRTRSKKHSVQGWDKSLLYRGLSSAITKSVRHHFYNELGIKKWRKCKQVRRVLKWEEKMTKCESV